jgi:LPS O-antigen subunit length determinant protein (WzzB/FepE family)
MSEATFPQLIQALRQNYRTLVLFSVLGLLVSASYSLFAPKIYEGFVYIALPQTNQVTNDGQVKEKIAVPSMLNARRILLNPNTITPGMLKACGMEDSNADRKRLVNRVYATDVDGGERNLLVRVRVPGKDLAQQCVDGVAQEMLSVANTIKNNYVQHHALQSAVRLTSVDAVIYRASRTSDNYILPRPFLTVTAGTLLGFLFGLFVIWLRRLFVRVN